VSNYFSGIGGATTVSDALFTCYMPFVEFVLFLFYFWVARILYLYKLYKNLKKNVNKRNIKKRVRTTVFNYLHHLSQDLLIDEKNVKIII